MLASATMATSVPAVAGPLPMLRLAPDEAPASVLGLDGGDSSTSANLTAALRKAFANRGLSGGEEISLEEMRLTMGCTNDEAACLAEGGKTLGVRRLVFGYLRSSGSGGGGYELDIQILDVTSGRLEAQATVPISKAELASDQIDAKATAIVNQLIPPAETNSDLPPRPDPLPEADPEIEPEEDEPKEPKEGGLYLGLEKPTPKWKWAAFGTSLGLTVLAAGATIGVWRWTVSPKLDLRGRLLEAAEASLMEEDPFNRVDPNMSGDLCEYNSVDNNGQELQTANGGPGARNAGVAEICTEGKNLRSWQLGLGIGTAVAGVTTLAFLGVLLIHKRKPVADAMLRHNLRLGLTPNLNGDRGLSFSGGLRF